jgi:hypothetical protein
MQTSPGTISNTQSGEYTVRRLSKDNLSDVAKLHAEVYGKPAPPGYFPQKYDTAYTGVEHVGFIAYNTDKIPMAYYGVIPCFIEYESKLVLAAQSADTMTHPQHRYKGMFVDLSNKTFELCRELGILLIFGFPNQNSYHGAIHKLGWKMTGTMSCFTIPVKSLPLESFAKRSGIFKKLYQRYIHFILHKKISPGLGVANSVITDRFAGINRSEAYLKYKMYSPSKVIIIDDSKIWISNKYGLMIGDIEGLNRLNFKTVINKLKKIARRSGVRQVQFHCSPDTGLHDLFAENYKASPSYPILFQDFGSSIPPEMIRFTFADIDIF